MSYGFTHNDTPNLAHGWVPRDPDPRLRVTLGEAQSALLSERAVPLRGVTWRVSGIEGWREPAEVATRTVDAPTGDGVLAMARRLGPRGIVISSNILAANGEGWRVSQMIEGLSRVHDGAPLVVEEGQAGLTRECDVRVLTVRTTWKHSAWAEVTLSLQADDPLRYGVGEHVLKSGRNVLLNPGDAIAYPVIDLVGPHSALTITHDGGSFAFPALGSGTRRTVDCRSGDVFNASGGRLFTGFSGPWPRVNVGGAEWQVSGLGSGTAKVRRFEAWT